MPILPPISKFYIPLPEAHLSTKPKPKHKLKVGQSYLIEEREPDRSVELFVDQITHGIPGLWITSLHPRTIRKKYDLNRTPILYVGVERPSDEVGLSITHLDRVKALTLSYLTRVPGGSVVFVDCFEKFVVANGFERALSFIQELGKICSDNISNLIVWVDPGAFTKRQLAEIERRQWGK